MQLFLFGEPEPKPDRVTGKKVPPSLEDVEQYCEQRDNGIDAEEFFFFYETNGWFQGKKKIKNWKACVITWEKREPKREHKSKSSGMTAIEAWALARKAAAAWAHHQARLSDESHAEWERMWASLSPRLQEICRGFGSKAIGEGNQDVVRGQFFKAWNG